MRVREDMVNGHGSCHGGFVAALADSAFAIACNTYDDVTVAAGFDIVFVGPARRGDELVAGPPSAPATVEAVSTTSPSRPRPGRYRLD